MENLRFRTAPDISDYKIPFAVNEQALTDWLRTLSMQQNYNSCKELFCLLQAFTRIEIDPQQHLVYLQAINTYLEDLVKQLEKNYLDAGFALSMEERAHVDIVTFAYAMLAENYSLLGRRSIDRLDAPELVFYLALQAAGRALLHMSQVYMQPYEGFWLFCYGIYSLAEKAGFLDVEIKSREFKGKTVHVAFKHILAFELLGTNQFRPRELKLIFRVLESFSDQVLCVKEVTQECAKDLCVFNLKQDQEPRHLAQAQTVKNDADRYVSPVRVAKTLYQLVQQESSGQGALKSINRSVFIRAVKSLSLAQKRKYTRIAEQQDGLGIIGFNNLISFLWKNNLNEKENSIPTQERDPRICGNWQAPDLELVPEGHEWMHQMETYYRKAHAEDSPINKILKLSSEIPHDSRVWKSSNIEKSKLLEDVSVGAFEIINSSAQGLYILWKSTDLKVRIGDIFAVISAKDKRVEIGLIRRVGKSTQQGVGLGIEMLGFESEVVGLMQSGQKELACWAIFLPGIRALKKQDSIVFNTSDFSLGEFVNIRHGEKDTLCRLNKLINSTSAVSHVELLYVTDSV